MVAVLIHDDLKNVLINDLHDLQLDVLPFRRKLHNLLYDPAPITMQTDEQKFLLGQLIDILLLPVRAHLQVLLHDIIAKLIVDELIDVQVKILEDLILEEIVGRFESGLDISGAVLIPAPFGDVVQVIEDFFLCRIYRKIAYWWHIDVLVALVAEVLLLVLQTQPG